MTHRQLVSIKLMASQTHSWAVNPLQSGYVLYVNPLQSGYVSYVNPLQSGYVLTPQGHARARTHTHTHTHTAPFFRLFFFSLSHHIRVCVWNAC